MKQRDAILKIVERTLHAIVLCLATMIVFVGAGGCDTSSPRGQIPGVLQSAPPLEEFDGNNNYRPYYRTAEMNTPRYLHQAIAHSGGLIWVFGGSDERGLSALDSVEFYDQSTFDDDVPPLESITGLWIDTNIEGDPITFINGARLLFTATEIGNSDILLIGGTTNLLTGLIHARAEAFEPSERLFRLVEGEMREPRFRHTSTVLSTGGVLIAGGQAFTTVTVIDEEIPEGQPGRERQETRFPSTSTCEWFLPTDDAFDYVRLLDNEAELTTLQTRRGRSDHAFGRLAGPDNILNGPDDMFFVTAGLQTLSAVSGLAPQNKMPGGGGFDLMTSVEVFDAGTNIFTLIASVRLTDGRLDKPYAINLGQFNDFTIDGVLGMGNSVLVTHGNVGGGCPINQFTDQLFLATYTPGAGPAQGIRFFESREDIFFSHIQHAEYIPPGGAPIAGVQVARCATNPVPMPRFVEPLVQGVDRQQTWVFSLAGVDIFGPPCSYNHSSAAMLAGCVFDPFFNVPVALVNNLDPRNLGNARRANPQNFLGIVGAWFTMDGHIDGTIDSWGGVSADRWAENRGLQRAYTVCTPLAGVDGRLGSFDDRILLTGGGRSYQSQGGEPTTPSAELFLPPGSSAFNRD